ncbi:MAG TPA: GNAT family N-acetyltransferase [Tepidisphaeraceae bacterium]|jgi:RimJ/RimL family protein N-acetyltransferase|nr:GNAT family N-acetyltransferase [Tepidisphaeraceae bacterium]
MEPILIDVPEVLETPRLILRAPRSGDAIEMNRGVHDSFAELHAWMNWAAEPPSLEATELFSRQSAASFLSRTALNYRIFVSADQVFAGCLSLFNIDWSIPKFEIGYWLRSSLCGNGLMTEAVIALAKMAKVKCDANRVEIRCDEKNIRSRRVAERAGFRLEGILANDSRDPAGNLRNTCVYAVVS